MQINEGIHLAYCTNIHRGEGWQETFQGLKEYSLKVKDKVSNTDPFAICLLYTSPSPRDGLLSRMPSSA